MTKEEVLRLENKRPHVVILGAGATIDAIPDGDKNGKKSSVMNGFMHKLNLSELLEGIELHTKRDDLEDIYSELYDRGEGCKIIRQEIESKIEDYFSSFEIPDRVTKYDLLVLSLTTKDCIATFNWDPLLLQAYQRVYNRITKNLPELIFLHGNVAAGYCPNCGRFGALNRIRCAYCGTPYEKTPLLFPVKHKDYSVNFIKQQWESLDYYLCRAKMLTIYGYSGPKSDIEAINMLTNAFEKYLPAQKYDYFEIIEKKDFDSSMLSSSWRSIIDDTHCQYKIVTNFFQSRLALYPRRTVEWLNKQNTGCWGQPKVRFTGKEDWVTLKEKVIPLLSEENNTEEL